ncbi:MAG: UDP-N-acetylmuramoyl-tripeptide--D-alanyl-D-alanine ligase [Lentisphaeria bacterium]|nr:UDP-N-acetylmuramoyl-tripeptide--D-alanyl-D-alanine ligase [Lentisphaeria bacterium]
MNRVEAYFTAAEAERSGAGVWQKEGTAFSGIFTDTRQNGSGSLFVALSGENFDAHDFLNKAVESGAAALCVERSKAHLAPAGIPLLLCDDTLKAYQALANFHRKRFADLTVFAVTGSVGKTSVKEMLRAICVESAGAAEYVLWTEGNTNNQIGVPRNLLRLTSAHRYAVLEAGTNHFGEIAPLSCAISPHVALVNSIAPCHLEFLLSLEGVAEEKSHICDGLKTDGIAVFPAEVPQLEILKQKAPGRVMLFGSGIGDVTVEYMGGTLRGSKIKLHFPSGAEHIVEWHLSGAHQAMNAAAAATAALAAGIAPEIIAAGLVKTELPGGRNRIFRSGGVTFIDDTYNANPAAVCAALKNLKEFADPAKLVLLLGEMRELGDASAAAHEEVLALAKELFPGCRLITVGSAYGQGALADAAAAREVIVRSLKPGDLLFAKGSRGVKLETALPEADEEL